jgi:hypothetical protein
LAGIGGAFCCEQVQHDVGQLSINFHDPKSGVLTQVNAGEY